MRKLCAFILLQGVMFLAHNGSIDRDTWRFITGPAIIKKVHKRQFLSTLS
ncbi:MAG: hypothetical protein U9N60_00175 [Thermodesulfobacteriota bacterium]|nr:hypothetical protein [Thermodesulfobacteriota bacterium]